MRIIMKKFALHSKRLQRILVISVFFLTHTSSIAISRLGTAVVRESNGLPCFSIQSDGETKDGLPLRQLIVKEARIDGVPEVPKDLWSFRAVDSSPKNLMRPTECIRYGEPPPEVVEGARKDLSLYRVYSVAVVARHENSSMIAYHTKFCMKLDKNKNIFVQNIPNDESLGNARYQVCAPPQ